MSSSDVVGSINSFVLGPPLALLIAVVFVVLVITYRWYVQGLVALVCAAAAVSTVLGLSILAEEGGGWCIIDDGKRKTELGADATSIRFPFWGHARPGR